MGPRTQFRAVSESQSPQLENGSQGGVSAQGVHPIRPPLVISTPTPVPRVIYAGPGPPLWPQGTERVRSDWQNPNRNQGPWPWFIIVPAI